MTLSEQNKQILTEISTILMSLRREITKK